MRSTQTPEQPHPSSRRARMNARQKCTVTVIKQPSPRLTRRLFDCLDYGPPLGCPCEDSKHDKSDRPHSQRQASPNGRRRAGCKGLCPCRLRYHLGIKNPNKCKPCPTSDIEYNKESLKQFTKNPPLGPSNLFCHFIDPFFMRQNYIFLLSTSENGPSDLLNYSSISANPAVAINYNENQGIDLL